MCHIGLRTAASTLFAQFAENRDLTIGERNNLDCKDCIYGEADCVPSEDDVCLYFASYSGAQEDSVRDLIEIFSMPKTISHISPIYEESE